MPGPRVDVRRAGTRARTRTAGIDSAHSFSFGHSYDPANASYGLLVAHNDDVLAAGAGYPRHRHRELEIVTWVLRGSLVHRDDMGPPQVLLPGRVQRTSAGRGVLHSETNDAPALDPALPAEPVRFVQAWVVPGPEGGEPAYEQRAVDDSALARGLVPVASGRPEHENSTAVRLGQPGAALLVARPAEGRGTSLPDAPYVHLFVAVGAVRLEQVGVLHEGDAVRLTATPGLRLHAVQDAEVLVWEMHASLTG